MIIGLNSYPVRIPVINPLNGFYLRWYYSGWHYWQFLPGRESLLTNGEKYRTYGTKRITLSSGQITLEQCSAIRTILNTREVYILTDAGWKNIRIESTSTPVKNNFVNGYEIELSAIIGSRDLSLTGFSPVTIIPVVPPVPDTNQCELVIGTQIWMCKNYDIKYPGSKVYNNDEANRAEYGGLYTWDQIMASGFVPAGWRVPTLEDWQILIAFIGNDSNAGGILKETGTDHWLTPNTDAIDTYGFKALGGGYNSGSFADLRVSGYFWTATEINSFAASHLYFRYNTGVLLGAGYEALKSEFMSVRLIKTVSAIHQDYGALYNWYAINGDI